MRARHRPAVAAPPPAALTRRLSRFSTPTPVVMTMAFRAAVRAALVALLMSAALVAAAQPLPDDGPRLPQWQQRMRNIDSLLSAGAIDAAINQLEDLRGSPPVRVRPEDYPRVLMLLARAYAWLGDAQRATERITEAIDMGYPAWHEIASSDDFVLVRGDDRFARVVEDARRHAAPWERLWQPPSGALRWRDTLPPELRAFGVSAVWSAVKYSFAYAERLGERSWDSEYVAVLREALATPSTLESYRVLQRMIARLGDGHTTIVMPPELADSVDYSVPLRTELIEGRVLVTSVVAPTLTTREIGVGDEIIAIDGVSVADYVARAIDPWISASSPQDRAVRCYDYALLAGAADSHVRLSMRGADGAVRERTLERSWCREDLAPASSIDLRRLPGNIGLIAINTFGDEYIASLFEAALRKLGETHALIIDLRQNAGGQTRLAFEVLARLIAGPFETHRWETPVHRAYFHARGRDVEWYSEPAGFITGDRARVYAAPVVLLVGARTLSAAENFAVAFEYARRGVIVGEPTAGSTGHTLEVLLPAGGACRIVTTRDCYPDGRAFNGIGVIPSVAARRTAADVRSGRDAALEAALAAARAQIEQAAMPVPRSGARGEVAP